MGVEGTAEGGGAEDFDAPGETGEFAGEPAEIIGLGAEEGVLLLWLEDADGGE